MDVRSNIPSDAQAKVRPGLSLQSMLCRAPTKRPSAADALRATGWRGAAETREQVDIVVGREEVVDRHPLPEL